MDGSSFVATWPKVAVHVDGKDHVILAGKRLPKGVTLEHAQVLAGFGAVVAAADPAEEPAPAEETHVSERPPLSATKEVWVEHAVTNGVARPHAENMTKEQLVTMFTG